MTQYLMAIVAVLLCSGLGGARVARAQLAADLCAPAGSAGFAATGMSANLSASNGAGASGSSGAGGNRLKAQTRTVSSTQPRSGASRVSYHIGYEEMQAGLKPKLQGLASMHPSTSGKAGLSSSGQRTASAPQSAGRSLPSLQSPLYSFVVGNEKGGSHSSASQQSPSGKPKRSASSSGSLIQSLTGSGSGRKLRH
jgi:hypothetical protein